MLTAWPESGPDPLFSAASAGYAPMYLLENPVLQRELLVNLRMTRAFVLLSLYLAALGGVVYIAWPQERQLDLTTNPEAAKRLVNLFFLGQYVLASLMAPSFAAGAITGEKERKSYEMLLATPLRPAPSCWASWWLRSATWRF